MESHTAWYRRPFLICGIALLIGIVIGLSLAHDDPSATAPVAASLDAGPTSTVTVTESATPEPATTVTRTVLLTSTVTRAASSPRRSTVTRPPSTASAPAAPQVTYYENCTAVRAAGADPIRIGDPGYSRHLDRDGDGVGCE